MPRNAAKTKKMENNKQAFRAGKGFVKVTSELAEARTELRALGLTVLCVPFSLRHPAQPRGQLRLERNAVVLGLSVPHGPLACS